MGGSKHSCMASYGACSWRVDSKQSKSPFSGNLLLGEWHVPSVWKLQRTLLGADGEVISSQPWRTEEKSIPLVAELIHRYTKPWDLVIDFTAGAGTVGIACRRLNRRCILNEMDGDLVDAFMLRLKYYHWWLTKTSPYQMERDEPDPHDGLSMYAYLSDFLSNYKNLVRQQQEDTLPRSNVPLGLPKYGSDEHTSHCATLVW
jgi:hypothetical protein